MKNAPFIILMLSFGISWAQNGGVPAPPQPSEPGITVPIKTTIPVKFGAPGERTWYLMSAIDAPATTPQMIKDQETAVSINKAVKTGFIVFEDKATGNAAVFALEQVLKDQKITVSETDWKYVSAVVVKVNKDNAPVYDITVRLVEGLSAGKSRTRSVILNEQAPGTAVFNLVTAGPIRVEVIRDADNRDIHEETLTMKDRAEKIPVFAYTTTAKAPTKALPTAPASGMVQPEENTPKANISITTYLLYLLALVVAIVIIVGVVKLVQGKNKPVAEMMSKLGVQLPSSIDVGSSTPAGVQSPSPAVPAGHCQFCGKPQDQCACGLASPTAASASYSGPPRLLGLSGNVSSRIFELNLDEVTVGREADNHIPLNEDGTISRRHAIIRKTVSGYFVVDLNSSNGTFINEVKITGEHPINPGDTVQFGMSKFKFEA